MGGPVFIRIEAFVDRFHFGDDGLLELLRRLSLLRNLEDFVKSVQQQASE